jgi:hypothetical protein
MSDRPRNPSRAGLFSGEAPSDRSSGETADPLQGHPLGPHHPASPPAIESATGLTDRAQAVSNAEAEQFARTLKDLIQSLPRRPGASSASAPGSAPEGIAGVATPTFEDLPAGERRAKSGEDDLSLATGSTPTGAGRGDSPAVGGYEAGSSARPDLWRAGGEGVTTVALAAPLSAARDGEQAGQPPVNGNRADVGGTSGGQADGGSNPFAAEAAMIGVAAVAIAAGVDPSADLGRRGSPSDRATIEPATTGGVPAAWTPETVAVGQIGPAGRNDEGFDRASASATSWGGASGGDPFATDYGNASPAVEGPSGVDMGPTNALLGQILDELRRHQQSASISSGRSVYPER